MYKLISYFDIVYVRMFFVFIVSLKINSGSIQLLQQNHCIFAIEKHFFKFSKIVMQEISALSSFFESVFHVCYISV